jgi:ATP-dependent DNA helicase RecQ
MTESPQNAIKEDAIKKTLRDVWGFDGLRGEQEALVQQVLSGQDLLAVLPTGYGKTLCFELPAVLTSGITLVVTPLVALMEDQVTKGRQRGLKSAALHGGLSRPDRKAVLKGMAEGDWSLLYISPEGLLHPAVWSVVQKSPVVRMVLDEAHCAISWGETFRPHYLRLAAVRRALPQKPALCAFTATAPPPMLRALVTLLELDTAQQTILKPYRPNLFLRVTTCWTPRQRYTATLAFLKQHRDQGGLIYRRTRAGAEELAQTLRQQGWKTAAYHAGMGTDQRRRVEAQWQTGVLPFVVATCAFGLGIDRSDVRWVLHYEPSLSLEEYLQEFGRAGRDQNPAEALLLVSESTGWLDPSDQQMRQYFKRQQQEQQKYALDLARKLPVQGHVTEVQRHFAAATGDTFYRALALLQRGRALQWHSPFEYQLQMQQFDPKSLEEDPAAPQMSTYATTRGCRWQFLLQAFGFDHGACGHCDRCRPM